jgi:hypothetical protein
VVVIFVFFCSLVAVMGKNSDQAFTERNVASLLKPNKIFNMPICMAGIQPERMFVVDVKRDRIVLIFLQEQQVVMIRDVSSSMNRF